MPNEAEEECDKSIHDLLRRRFDERTELGRTVGLSVEDGCVELSGAVSSYYLKQLAQSIAMSIGGVRRVVNDLEVSYPSPRATSHVHVND